MSGCLKAFLVVVDSGGSRSLTPKEKTKTKKKNAARRDRFEQAPLSCLLGILWAHAEVEPAEFSLEQASRLGVFLVLSRLRKDEVTTKGGGHP